MQPVSHSSPSLPPLSRSHFITQCRPRVRLAQPSRNVLIKSNAQSVAHLVFHGSSRSSGSRSSMGHAMMWLHLELNSGHGATAAAAPALLPHCLWQEPSMLHQSARREQQIPWGSVNWSHWSNSGSFRGWGRCQLLAAMISRFRPCSETELHVAHSFGQRI